MSRVKVKSDAKYYSGAARFSPMQRTALLALSLLLVAVGSIVLWQKGWPQRQAHRAVNAALAGTVGLGLSLQDVRVEGRERIGADELREALQIKRGMPILALDRDDMAARLRRLPWLAEAHVERRLPGTLLVQLTERQPLARWQYKGAVRIVDMAGDPIAVNDAAAFARLPLIVGAGAPRRAYDLLAELNLYPRIQAALRAATCVGERRWDLQLEPGVLIRLPEGRESYGLKRLDTLMRDQQILSREVQAVDLRFPDRLIIERPPGAAMAKTVKGALKR